MPRYGGPVTQRSRRRNRSPQTRYITLPQYLHKQAAVLIEDFESAAAWTNTSTGTGSISNDTTNKTSGSQSLAFNVNDASGVKATKAISLNNLLDYPVFAIDVRNANNANGSAAFRVNFWSGSVGVKGAQLASSVTIYPQGGSFYRYYLAKSDFNLVGGAAWTDTFTTLEISWVNGSVGQVLSVDRLDAVWPMAAVCPVFHDGRDNHYTQAFPEFRKRGMRSSVTINSGGANAPGSANRMTVGQIKTLLSAGWEISNHSDTHPSTPGVLSQATYETELSNCATLITGTIGAPTAHSKTHHYPSPTPAGDFSAIWAALAAQSMTIAAAISTQANDNMGLPFPYMFNMPARGFAGLSTAALQTKIDYAIAHGTLLMMWCHDSGGTTPDVTQPNLGWFLDYCIQKRVPILRLTDVVDLHSGPITVQVPW